MVPCKFLLPTNIDFFVTRQLCFYSSDRRRSFYFASRTFVSNINSKIICNTSLDRSLDMLPWEVVKYKLVSLVFFCFVYCSSCHPWVVYLIDTTLLRVGLGIYDTSFIFCFSTCKAWTNIRVYFNVWINLRMPFESGQSDKRA